MICPRCLGTHYNGVCIPLASPSMTTWTAAGMSASRPHVTPAEARAKLAALLADTPIEQEPPAPALRLDHEPGLLGDLDLAAEGTIRIERLGDSAMCIRVEHEGGAVVVNLHAKGGKLRQTVEVERG